MSSPFFGQIKQGEKVASATHEKYASDFNDLIQCHDEMFTVISEIISVTFDTETFLAKFNIYYGFYARLARKISPLLSLLERGYYNEVKAILRTSFEDLEYIFFMDYYPDEVENILLNNSKYTAGYIHSRIGKNVDKYKSLRRLYRYFSSFVHFSNVAFGRIFNSEERKVNI